MSTENNQKTLTAPDFNKLEQDILKFWDENKIFEKSLESTKTRSPTFFMMARLLLRAYRTTAIFWHLPLKTPYLAIKP